MSKKGNNWAKLVGHGLAHVQDGMDFAIDIGFKTMKKVADLPEEKKKKNDNKYIHMSKKAGKEVLGFLGTAGDSFYKKYGELKKEREE